MTGAPPSGTLAAMTVDLPKWAWAWIALLATAVAYGGCWVTPAEVRAKIAAYDEADSADTGE